MKKEKEKNFNVLGVDHIGIVTKKNSDLKNILENILKFQASKEEEVKDQKIKVRKYKINKSSSDSCSTVLETLEPTSKESIISKFREKKGSGIHHIALSVDHIQATIDTLLNNKIRMINKQPIIGADSCKIAFIHPSSTAGILIELIEK